MSTNKKQSSPSGEPAVIRKKVKPFPIKGRLKASATGEGLPISVMKLTPIGFLAEVMPTGMQPGEKFECFFELPVSHHAISAPVSLIKLYNQGRVHLLELHFVALKPEDRARIDSFLRAIRGHT